MTITREVFMGEENIRLLFSHLSQKIMHNYQHQLNNDFYQELQKIMQIIYLRYEKSIIRTGADFNKKVLFINKKVVQFVLDTFEKAYKSGDLLSQTEPKQEQEQNLMSVLTSRNLHFPDKNKPPITPPELISQKPDQLDNVIEKPDELLKKMEEQRMSDKEIALNPPDSSMVIGNVTHKPLLKIKGKTTPFVEKIPDEHEHVYQQDNGNERNEGNERKERKERKENMEDYIRSQVTDAHMEFQQSTAKIELRILTKLTDCIEKILIKNNDEKILEKNMKQVTPHEPCINKIYLCINSSDQILQKTNNEGTVEEKEEEKGNNNYRIRLPMPKQNIISIQLKKILFQHDVNISQKKNMTYIIIDIPSNIKYIISSQNLAKKNETIVGILCDYNFLIDPPKIYTNNDTKYEGNNKEEDYILNINFRSYEENEFPEHTLIFEIEHTVQPII